MKLKRLSDVVHLVVQYITLHPLPTRGCQALRFWLKPMRWRFEQHESVPLLSATTLVAAPGRQIPDHLSLPSSS